ncbi:MAG: hypothetical protein RH982_07300 [Parvibaculum sp.]
MSSQQKSSPQKSGPLQPMPEPPMPRKAAVVPAPANTNRPAEKPAEPAARDT